MSLTVNDLRKQGILDELADVFFHEGRTNELLDRLDFPYGRRPKASTSGDRWHKICQEIARGLTTGGLERLLGEAATLYPHNSSFCRFATTNKTTGGVNVSKFGGFSEELLDELESVVICTSLLPIEVRELYRRCSPPGWPPLSPTDDDGPRLTLEAVRSLGQAPRQTNDSFPLLQLTHALIERTRGQARQTLKEWFEVALAHLASDASDAKVIRSACQLLASVKRSDDYQLLVKIKPHSRRANVCAVKAWLTGELTPLLPAEEWDPELYRYDQLPALLAELRTRVARRGIPLERLWLEFIVPEDLLLSTDYEQLLVRLKRLDQEVPVGVIHPVIVRPLERTWEIEEARSLALRWNDLEKGNITCRIADLDDDESLAESQGLLLGLDCPGGLNLYLRLQDASRVVCAIVDHRPRDNVFRALLQAGLGVILWVRSNSDEGEKWRATLEWLVREHLQDLPRQLLKERKKHLSRDQSAIDLELTLLWDDPTRPCPDSRHRFKAPARGGF